MKFDFFVIINNADLFRNQDQNLLNTFQSNSGIQLRNFDTPTKLVTSYSLIDFCFMSNQKIRKFHCCESQINEEYNVFLS